MSACVNRFCFATFAHLPAKGAFVPMHTWLVKTRRKSLLEASTIRTDVEMQNVFKDNSIINAHPKCYKAYSDTRSAEAAARRKSKELER
ncbi:hypothetical protein J6590_028097 [Homalodisca vitripennis]|nr:hypothetical protein J6590_028097 [Homalodisca vitripennis]